jgi:hypothetical protein
MAFSSETVGKVLASGRHYVSTTVGFIGGIGIMSAAQSKGVTDSVNQIFDGLKMIFEGGSNLWAILVVAFPLIGGVMGKIASNSASVPSQAAAVKAAVQDPNTSVSLEAKAAILDAAAELPEVVEPIKVADPTLATVTESPLVKPA